MINGRKIPINFKNPFDNIIIDFSENYLNPIFRKMKFTANMITLLSFIT